MPEIIHPNQIIRPPQIQKPNGETQGANSRIKNILNIFGGNKGIIIAVIVGLIAIIIGFSTLVNFDSAAQFEGMIKKVEQQTQEFKNNGQ